VRVERATTSSLNSFSTVCGMFRSLRLDGRGRRNSGTMRDARIGTRNG
jgi:hypothetical protein